MKNFVSMEQVHGNNVVYVGLKDAGKIIKACDGLITNCPEIALKVHTADCLPISIVDKVANSVGLIHAGWRGLENRIVIKAIGKMRKLFLSNPSDLIVNVGPHICVDHYEVKSDVASKFVNYDDAILFDREKMYLDLGKVVEIQLLKSGVKGKNISISRVCTFENVLLSSYRRGDLNKRSTTILRIP